MARYIETKKTAKHTGTISWFFETGCEGTCWIFEIDGKKGYDALHFLDKGDWLKIYGTNGSAVFEGKINPDYKAGWKPYPQNPKQGQPCAFGLWIHWTQKGWEPEQWAELFLRENMTFPGEKQSRPKLRAELIKAQK